MPAQKFFFLLKALLLETVKRLETVKSASALQPAQMSARDPASTWRLAER